jgi:Mor family transcriptional regulator
MAGRVCSGRSSSTTPAEGPDDRAWAGRVETTEFRPFSSKEGSSLGSKAFVSPVSQNGASHTAEPGEECAWLLLAQKVGAETLQQLAAKFGGTRLYIPHSLTSRSDLCAVVGLDAAQQVVAIFAGERIYIPIDWELSLRKRGWREQVIILRAKKLSVSRIARTLGCSERHVYKVISKNRAAKKT